MNLIRVLRNTKARKIWKVFLLGVKNPLFVFPTLLATKRCIHISTKHYGKAHHQNGPANAFRHALWNYLIAKKCLCWSAKREKVLHWTQRITDWHEEAFPNTPLAKAMDLHNNAVGRYLFSKYITESLEKFIERLIKLTKESRLIQTESDIPTHHRQLVHIIPTK